MSYIREVYKLKFRNIVASPQIVSLIDSINTLFESPEGLRFRDLLHTLSVPFSVDGGANSSQSVYTSGYAEGYAKAINDIIHFRELYINQKPEESTQHALRPTFGGDSIAVTRGDITKKELANVR